MSATEQDPLLPRVRTCATDEVYDRILAAHPECGLTRARLDAAATERTRRGLPKNLPLIRIPVVVHLLTRAGGPEISDAEVQAQIEVLNQDFRALNEDQSSVPAPFRPLIADACIEFALATLGPDGRPTTGITRTKTRAASFSSDDLMKSSRTGGVDAWPAADYLNIWVCRLSGGLLGYAQFPGGPADTDGVVILDTAFGTGPTAKAPFDRGRTTVHEVGHWLDLRHIWGDDIARCGGSDEVADTPNQGGPNTGKPRFPRISCDNGPHGDLFMNYMDYVDDEVMVLFTAGQVARMRATLDLVRQGFVNPRGFAAAPDDCA